MLRQETTLLWSVKPPHSSDSRVSTEHSGVDSYGALGHVPPSSISNNFILSLLCSKPESQLSKYCVLCEISWCRCQQLTALSISTASVTKLLVIEPLLATNAGDATDGADTSADNMCRLLREFV